MPVHDWTRVDAGIFHAFHCAWIPELSKALNGGMLPQGFYALAEHAGRAIADVLTLHAGNAPEGASLAGSLPAAHGPGTAVAEALPRVHRRETAEGSLAMRRRMLAIRHVSGHRLIALLEILSPANKDRRSAVNQFVTKAVEALDAGVHVLMVDLFPPGARDPQGMHGEIRRRLEISEVPYDLPADAPLTAASYSAGTDIEIYVNHMAVGSPVPETPLFLYSDRYINVPLESTYQEAWRGMPMFWREVLEGRTPTGA